MRNLVMGMATLLAVGLAGSAYAVCVERDCTTAGGDPGTETVCCNETNPDNPPGEPTADVIACGTIEVESAIVAGCIGPAAGENNIGGCSGVRGAVTTADVVPDSDTCEEEAVAACEACGCSSSSGCVAN